MGKFNAQLKIFVVLLTCTTFLGWIDPASDSNEEGVRLYNEDKYDEAISKFSDAQSFVQESDSLNFNIANSHYKEGKLPEAEKAFKNIIKTENKLLKAKANYNLGNTMYKQNKFKESLDYYKKAIELSEEEGGLPDEDVSSLSEDAKYNFEFVRKKMEEMPQEQQEEKEKQEQNEDEQEQQDQEEQEQDKQQEEKEPEQQEQDEQQEQNEQQQEEQKEKDEQEKNPTQENEMQEPPPPQPHEKKEMTKEEAERLLDTLNQAEMAARHSQEKEKSAHYNIEKDW